MSKIKNIVQRYKFLGSSQDPEKLKLRVSSGLLYLVPLVIGVLRLVGVDDVNETELVGLVDIVSNIVMYGSALYATVLQGYGWWRALKK